MFRSEGQAEAGWNGFMAELVKKDPDMTKWWSTVGSKSSLDSPPINIVFFMRTRACHYVRQVFT